MAGSNQSLKNWKTYYKERYKKTGNKKYKQKLKELEKETTPYSFDYDADEIKSKIVLMRANAIVIGWERLKIKTETEINFERIKKILNRGYNEMLVTDIMEYDLGNIYIYFEDEFTLYRSTGTNGKWKLDEEH